MQISLKPSNRILNSPNYKWWAYIGIAIGLFLTVMDQSGTNIALPKIGEHFNADIPTVQWISLGYILATSAMFMPAGRLSDMVGRKYVYMGGFLIFIAASAIGGSSQIYIQVVIAKIIQGIGSAAIGANGMAMIADIFPERERGKALGLYMTIIGTGSISGPIVGGFLVSALGWRSVFYASVPVGIIAIIAAWLVLKHEPPRKDADSDGIGFDWGGAAISSAALISLLLALTNAHRLGWDSPVIIAGFVIGVGLFISFLWWEHRVSDPMLNLNFFTSRVFSMGVSARFLSFIGGSSVFFLMPFFLVQGLGYEPSRAGLFMVPGSIGMAVIGPISGRFSDTIGTRWLTVAGMGSSGIAFLMFSRLSVDTSPLYIIVGMALQGMGMGLFSSPNTSAIMSAVRKSDYGIASAFLNTTRTTANLSGVAIATTVVTFTMGAMGFEPNLSAVSEGGGEGIRGAFVTGMGRAFLISGIFVFASTLISALRSDSTRIEEETTEPVGQNASERTSSVGDD